MKLPYLQHFRPNTWAPAWVPWLVIANGLCNCSFCRRLVDLHNLQWMPCWMVPKLSGNRVLKSWGAPQLVFLADFLFFGEIFWWENHLITHSLILEVFGEQHVQGAPPKDFFSGMKTPCWRKPSSFAPLTRRKKKSRSFASCYLCPDTITFNCLLDTARHQRWVLVSQLLVIPALELGSVHSFKSLVGGRMSPKKRPVFPIVGTMGSWIKVFSYPGSHLEASNCNRKCHWMHLEAVHAAYGSILSAFHSIGVRWRSIGYEKRIFDSNFRAANANATPPRVWKTTTSLQPLSRGWHCKILLKTFRMFKKNLHTLRHPAG